jgi:uncharacterized membrane protein (DUF373 family)
VASAQGSSGRSRTPSRERLARGFSFVEDAVYIALGVMLAAAAVVQLVSLIIGFWGNVMAGTVAGGLITLLDQILLVLMIVEILYTVQVSLREHVLAPEPFILVALIAGVRRILVVTAEFASRMGHDDAQFRNAMIELGLLTVMTLVLVGCLVLLRQRHAQALAERA